MNARAVSLSTVSFGQGFGLSAVENAPLRADDGVRPFTSVEHLRHAQWLLRAAEARRQAALYEAEALIVELDSGEHVSDKISALYVKAARELATIERLQREVGALRGNVNAPRAHTGD